MPKRFANRQRARRTMRLLLLLIISTGSIVAYVLLAITINGQPSYEPFDGWAAVFQPTNEPLVDKVTLKIQSTALGDHPQATFTVAVCGKLPYSGYLLLGGKARLNRYRSFGATPYSSGLVPLRIHEVNNLSLHYVYPRGPVFSLGNVQVAALRFPNVATCPESQPVNSSGYIGGGAAIALTGALGAPIQRAWSAPLAWWDGPHFTEVWPLLGTIPGVPSGDLGSFTRIGGILTGQWIFPTQQILQVNADAVPLSANVDSTVPPSVGRNALAWSSTYPMNPMARLTDSVAITALRPRHWRSYASKLGLRMATPNKWSI